MKWRLVHKLLLALFASTAVVLVGILWLMRASIGSGFTEFVQAQERVQLAEAAPWLAEYHRNQGSWQGLVENPQRFDLLLRRALNNGDADPLSSPGGPPPGAVPPRNRRPPPGGPRSQRPGGPREPRPMRGGSDLPQRVSLLSADRSVLLGPPGLSPDPETLVPITSDDALVGWLYAAAPRGEFGPLEQAFIERARRALLLALALGLAVAALLSVLMARHLVRPISAITDGIHALSQGDYGVQVDTGNQDEIARLGRDVNQLARTLADHEQSRQRWMADIAHELRTPLTIINGELEAMSDGVRPLTPENLASVQAEVGRFAGLIEDLQLLAMSDSGALAYRMASIDLSGIVSEAVDAFSVRATSAGLDLALHPDPPALMLQGDAARLRQLADNLLENAIRYTDAPGRIQVRLERAGASVLMHISDTAPGIDASDCDRIFNRLYRVESSRNRGTGGSGLGLSIARNIVSAHGGRISAAPGALGGLDITVTLPLDA